MHDVIVGNEPNLNLFWMPQFGPDGADVAAKAYLLLLAETYDALKAVSPSVNVIGGSLSARGSDRPRARGRPTRRPASSRISAGVSRLGARPAGDGQFSLHPYPEGSSIPADFEHPKSTAIGLADYDKLVDLLGNAFDGTAQPGSHCRSSTASTACRRRSRPGSSAPTPAPSSRPRNRSTRRPQARAYADAIAIAACDPTVSMLLFFHVSDEQQLERLQTGVFYADDTPKSSWAPGRRSCPRRQSRSHSLFVSGAPRV